ncbi:MAG: hypothetical protein ABIE03_06630 [Patescibacteria group bacterium]|nr:hypothetical protein [Patescibacteria group bacterium]
MANYSVEDLIVKGCTIKSREVDGKVLWTLKFEFEEFQQKEEDGGNKTPVSLGFSDFDLGIERIEDLDGFTTELREKFHDGGDGSLYLFEHNPLNWMKLKFTKAGENRYSVECECSVEFSGFTGEGDQDKDFRLSFTTIADHEAR